MPILWSVYIYLPFLTVKSAASCCRVRVSSSLSPLFESSCQRALGSSFLLHRVLYSLHCNFSTCKQLLLLPLALLKHLACLNAAVSSSQHRVSLTFVFAAWCQSKKQQGGFNGRTEGGEVKPFLLLI